jgi:hypothetical protein
MVVAMLAMGVVQPTVDEIVGVVTLRNRLVAAARAMLVAIARMIWSAANRVHIADLENVFIHVTLVRVLHVAILQVINMITMVYRNVSAVRPVLVCGARHPSLLLSGWLALVEQAAFASIEALLGERPCALRSEREWRCSQAKPWPPECRNSTVPALVVPFSLSQPITERSCDATSPQCAEVAMHLAGRKKYAMLWYNIA